MRLLLLALTACAPRSAPTTPAAAPTVLTAEDLDLSSGEVDVQEAPEAVAVAPSAPMASAPVLLEEALLPCPDDSPLCRVVRCGVENRMLRGFPTRWTASLFNGERPVHDENLRWVIPPSTRETRDVIVPLATALPVVCHGSPGVQLSASARACDDDVYCVDVLCSAWTNGAALDAYVDARLTLADGTRYDHDAVAVSVPSDGDIAQVSLRFTPGAEGWAPAPGTASPPALDLQPACFYWEGSERIRPLPP